MTQNPLRLYLDALLHGSGGRFGPGVIEVLRHGACARCALRFAGVRTAVYAVPPPDTDALRTALVAACSQQHGTPHAVATQPVVEAARPDDVAAAKGGSSHSECGPEQNGRSNGVSAGPSAQPAEVLAGGSDSADPTAADHTYRSSATTVSGANEAHATGTKSSADAGVCAAADSAQGDGVQQQDSTVGSRICPLCLGILQVPDSPQALPVGTARIALPDMDASGGDWRLLPTGDVPAIAAAARSEGHDTEEFSVALSVPAAVQVRHLAMAHALRAALPGDPLWADPLAATEGGVDVKEALKRAVTGQLEAAIGWRYAAEAPVRVSLMWMHPASSSSVEFLFGARGDQKRYKRKRGERHPDVHSQFAPIGRMASEGLFKLARNVQKATFLQHAPDLKAPVGSCAQVAVKVTRGPVHVGGRYRKLRRDISNSPWIPGKCVTSVQEELERVVLPGMRADLCKFMSAGREDADVRMLGRGRPFVLEVINARALMPPQSYFDDAQKCLNESNCGVEAEALQPVSRDMVAALKLGEEHKQKSYVATCRLSASPDPERLAALNASTDILVEQQTPTRVSQRRADLVRKRLVHSISCEMIEGSEQHDCVLKLRTQAGTYIKEFVHSDNGRTVPSLGSLLSCEAQILELDVAEVHMDYLASVP